MALPQTLDPTTPLSSASPSGAPTLLTNIKQYLTDTFGLTTGAATSQTGAAFSITTTGIVTVSQSVFNVPTMVTSAPSTMLTLNAGYSQILMEVGTTIIGSYTATGQLLSKPFVEWPTGTTGIIGTQGAADGMVLRAGTANLGTALTQTGVLLNNQFVEWPSGTTGVIGGQGAAYGMVLRAGTATKQAAVTQTGLLNTLQFIEWPSGTTGVIAAQGADGVVLQANQTPLMGINAASGFLPYKQFGAMTSINLTTTAGFMNTAGTATVANLNASGTGTSAAQFAGMKFNSFQLQVKNNAGTQLQHAIVDDGGGAAGLFVGSISGFSSSLTATPTQMTNSVGFATGCGIASNSNAQFIFNTGDIALISNSVPMVGVPELWTGGNVNAVPSNAAIQVIGSGAQNIGGVNINRMCLNLSTQGNNTGQNWTTFVPCNMTLRVKMLGFCQ